MKNLTILKTYRLFVSILGTLFCASCAHATDSTFNQQEINQFIHYMVDKHDYDQSSLEQMFSQVGYSQTVIDAITRPAEKLPWYKYRKIFLTEERVNGGVEYWQEYSEDLDAAEVRYGIPPEYIVAIIGVETQFGQHTGRYRVMDSLSTLAFTYPKRADFFRRELEEFLLLAREQDIDPLEAKGSYAGAMGIPQFISTSYRSYAVDFDGNGRVDLWDNHTDAIGSVANYFKDHGWRTGEPVIFPIAEMPAGSLVVSDSPKPDRRFSEIRQAGVVIRADISDEMPVTLLEFESVNGIDYWLGLNNFYVITRYNHSQLYALAVYLLAQKIRDRYQRSS